MSSAKENSTIKRSKVGRTTENTSSNLTVAKIESKSTHGLAVNAKRSCVDIDAAS